MLARKIDQRLLAWKQQGNHNPLVIKGLRQCGKTSSALAFARQNYRHVCYLNFVEDSHVSQSFASSLRVDDIVMYLSALPGAKPLVPHETCIILDEIQECPQARTALKFFKLDGRYDVIATGSLLGVSGYAEPTSISVGYETIIEMTPMDFEEFLWANGISSEVIDAVAGHAERHEPVPPLLHQRFRELLLQYVMVGGMPAVVDYYVKHRQISEVTKMQRDIVNSYRDDMLKHAPAAEKGRIRECFNSIPRQLAKENKKFQYSIIKKGASAKQYEGSLQWIEDAGIVRRCHNLSITELPLDGNAINDIFKVYMSDMGLFVSMLDEGTAYDILQGNLQGYKGAIFENLAADMLSKMGRKLYYFHKDSGLEIDFVTRHSGQCCLLEVKSTSGNVKSSKTVLANPGKYHVEKCLKFGDYNVGPDGPIATYPLYLLPFCLKAEP